MDRSRRSPFDITSQNTFLGSIVSSLYPILYSSDSVMDSVSNINSTVTHSIAVLFPGVYAEGNNSYQNTFGGCPTPKSITAEGDIYCNKIVTFDPEVITMQYSDLEERLETAGQLERDGTGVVNIEDNSGLAQFATLEVYRESTPGVKDANICEALKQGQSIIGRVLSIIKSALGIKQSCEGADADIATGKAFINSSENSKWDDEYKYYQAFYLKTYSRELLGYYDGSINPTVAFKEKYFTEHPKDNSFEGIIARRTGWLKEDVIAGIDAIRYIAYLNQYHPSERYAFYVIPEQKEISFIDEESVDEDINVTLVNTVCFNDRRKQTQTV